MGGSVDDWRIIGSTNYDLIVVGMGLPESIIAAAAARAGKAVLQINPDRFYDSPFTSLHPKHLAAFLNIHSNNNNNYNGANNWQTKFNESDYYSEEFNILPLKTRPLYSSVEVKVYSPQVLEDTLDNDFNIDLAGPKVLFCADPMIDLILKADVEKYTIVNALDASYFVCNNNDDDEGQGRSKGCGSLSWNDIPDSRKAIFKDRNLSFKEKNQLMRFFNLVHSHYFDEINNTSNDEEKQEKNTTKIFQEDLEIPFVEFLTRKIGLSPKLTSIILYAIAMADYEQDNVEVCKNVLKTKEGINRLMLYHKSIDRFPDVTGAVVYPNCGQGALTHAFCRSAAVMGCVSITQMPVVGLLVNKDGGNYKGVKLVNGKELFSHRLILAPSFIIPSELTFSPSLCPQDGYYYFGLRDAKEKVVRGICITESSLKPDITDCLAFYPPRSLCPDQLTSVRIFQSSNIMKACPSGMFVVYLSTTCEDAAQGKKSLKAAIDSLFSTPVSGNSEENATDPLIENTVVKLKPTLLWSTLYIQELIMGGFDCVSSTPMPDGNLHYNDIVDAAIKLFQKMYPDEELFPKIVSPWDLVTENGACSSDSL